MTHVLDPLLKNLAARAKLSSADCQAVLALPFHVKTVPASTYLIREGEPPRNCIVLLSGFAFRHKLMGDGGRQIVSMHIPGETLDFQSLFLDCADHNAQAMTDAELAIIPYAALHRLIADHPAIARAILVLLVVDASILREWIANIGRRDARTRLAHLLCEFAARLDAGQLTVSDSYELPMTQEQLGDALGLTSVHINRSIRSLEAEGLVARQRRVLTFPDVARLRQIAGFSSLYLHLHQQAA